MKRRGKIIALVGMTLILVASSLLPACAQPKPAGELKVALGTFEHENFVPNMWNYATIRYGGHLYDSLVALNSDGKLDPDYSLAERWEASEGGKVWTFYLRKGVKFHNGDELTAEDVKFTLGRAALPEAISSNAKYFKASLEEVKVVDRYTAEVRLKTPDTLFIDMMATAPESRIVPKDYFAQVGEEGFAEKPIGSGPWKFVRREVGNLVEYEANEQHWRQVPQFAKLRLLLIPEEFTRVAMLKRGEVDIAMGLSSPRAAEIEKAGFTVKRLPVIASLDVLPFMLWEPEMAFHDKRVRKALALAINREEIVDKIFLGLASVASYPHVTTVRAWFDPDLPPYPYDPDEARRLLAEAGYPKDITLKFYTFPQSGVPQKDDVAFALAGYWQEVGVKVSVIRVDSLGTLKPRYRSEPQEFESPGEMMLTRSSNAPTGTVLRVWYLGRGDGGLTTLAREYDEITELWHRVKAEEDGTKRMELMGQIYRIIYDEALSIPIAHVDAIGGVGKTISEWTPVAGQLHLLRFETVTRAK